MRRLALKLAASSVVLVALVATGCGIPGDSKPRALDPNGLPPSLSTRGTGTTILSPGDGTTQAIKLYLVKTAGDADVLVPRQGQVPIPSDPTQLPRAVLEQLIAQQPVGTNPADAGLINAIPATVQVLDATLDGDVLDLNLSDLGSVELTRQRQAAAQIVFTATALPGIDAVRFSTDGQQTAVPLDDQTAAAGQPVRRSDYPKLMPQP